MRVASQFPVARTISSTRSLLVHTSTYLQAIANTSCASVYSVSILGKCFLLPAGILKLVRSSILQVWWPHVHFSHLILNFILYLSEFPPSVTYVKNNNEVLVSESNNSGVNFARKFLAGELTSLLYIRTCLINFGVQFSRGTIPCLVDGDCESIQYHCTKKSSPVNNKLDFFWGAFYTSSIEKKICFLLRVLIQVVFALQKSILLLKANGCFFIPAKFQPLLCSRIFHILHPIPFSFVKPISTFKNPIPFFISISRTSLDLGILF